MTQRLRGHLFTMCSDSVRVYEGTPLYCFGEAWVHCINSESGSIDLELVHSSHNMLAAHIGAIDDLTHEINLRTQDTAALEQDIERLKKDIFEDGLDVRNHDTDAQELLAYVMMQGKHARYIKSLQSRETVYSAVNVTLHRSLVTIPARIVTEWVHKSDVKTVLWVPIQEENYCISIEEETVTRHNIELPVHEMQFSLVSQANNGAKIFEGGLQMVSGCTFDEKYLYVCDDRNHRTVIFDVYTAQVVKFFGIRGTQKGEFKFMGGICNDAKHLYVCDWRNQRLQIFDKSNCEFIREILFSEERDDGPKDVVCHGGVIYLLISYLNRIQVYDATSSDNNGRLLTWGEEGTNPGCFKCPMGICVDDKYVYVSDTQNHRIQVFNRQTGNFHLTWGCFGSENGQFKNPKGISVWSGYLLVADCDNNRVQCFTIEGLFLCIFNSGFQLCKPYYVQFNENYIFISDTGNDRVIRFENAYGSAIRQLNSF